MSKTVPEEFQTILASGTTHVATLVKILRQDARVLAFTDADVDIQFQSLNYSASKGINSTSIQNQVTLAVDNLSVQGPFVIGGIERNDLESGRFDGAMVEVYVVNRLNPDEHCAIIRTGFLGKVEIRDNDYTVEFRGLKQYLQNEIGQLYSPVCRAELGDERCKISLNDWMEYGVVIGVDENNPRIRFAAELYERHSGNVHSQYYNVSLSKWFNYGRVEWRIDFTPPPFNAPVTCYRGTGTTNDICFGDGDGTITAASGAWDGFSVGDWVIIDELSANKGTYEVLDVSDTVLTLDASFVFEDNSLATIRKYATNLNYNTAREIQTYEIEAWSGLGNISTFRLFQKTPFDIHVGDLFRVFPGCNKTISMCKTRFNNIMNRRAEDFVPGPDKSTQVPYSGARI